MEPLKLIYIINLISIDRNLLNYLKEHNGVLKINSCMGEILLVHTKFNDEIEMQEFEDNINKYHKVFSLNKYYLKGVIK